ncbi:MAG: GAP family protein [Bauldia sp.]
MTVTLFLTILACAVLDSLSPSVVGIVAYLLLVAPRPVGSRVAVYLATVAGLYFLLGVALMAGVGPLLAALSDVATSRSLKWVQLVLGVGLFILSFRIGGKKRRRPPGHTRHVPTGIRSMIGLGIATTLLEAGLAVPYFAAIGLMTTAELPVAVWLPTLAVYVTIMIAPALGMVALDALLGARIRPRLARLREWIERNTAETVSWIVGIVGFLLAYDAAAFLFSGETVTIGPIFG